MFWGGNMEKNKPQIFIASSVEGLSVAYTIQESLEHDAECTVWDQGVFEPSSYTIIDLISRLKSTDYGIFVFTADDTSTIREESKNIVRDNVILELGLFMGAIGRENCFIVMPNARQEVHLPTDLTGITTTTYNSQRRDGNLKAALGPAVNRIRDAIQKNGVIKKAINSQLIEQIDIIGLSAFYSSRDDYGKYRASASSIDKYINQAQNSICMVSITLATGIAFDDICKVFKSKLKKANFSLTVSLLNPLKDELYQAISPLFGQSANELQNTAKSTLRNLIKLRNSLNSKAQSRFQLRVHQTLPFGSAIILDGDFSNGTIQIETKPYGVGMRKSFAFELNNNGGDFYQVLKQSYVDLIRDGVDASNFLL